MPDGDGPRTMYTRVAVDLPGLHVADVHCHGRHRGVVQVVVTGTEVCDGIPGPRGQAYQERSTSGCRSCWSGASVAGAGGTTTWRARESSHDRWDVDSHARPLGAARLPVLGACPPESTSPNAEAKSRWRAFLATVEAILGSPPIDVEVTSHAFDSGGGTARGRDRPACDAAISSWTPSPSHRHGHGRHRRRQPYAELCGGRTPTTSQPIEVHMLTGRTRPARSGVPDRGPAPPDTARRSKRARRSPPGSRFL
jgi:hypothetical protein